MYGAVPPLPPCLYGVYLATFTQHKAYKDPWLRILFRFDDWLTLHRSITLVDLQLDAQNSYLLAYNTVIKILCMFRALPCSSSGGVRRNCIYAASGIVTVCR